MTLTRTPRPVKRGMDAALLAYAHELHEMGMTYAEIAAVLREGYGHAALRAARLARCLSQYDAAELWCVQWPDRPITNKQICYWEAWSRDSGPQPKLESLQRLALIYCCRVSDLVADLGDYRDRDPAYRIPPLFTVCPTCGALATSAD